MKYDILNGEAVDFVERMNALIADGWEPIGGIAINESGILFQAIVKRPVTEIKFKTSAAANFKEIKVSNKSDIHRRIGDGMGKLIDCVSDPVRHSISVSPGVVELPQVVRGKH